MNFNEESFRYCMEDIKRISVEHYEESAPYKDFPLSVTWSRFIEAEDSGHLKLYTARNNDGSMVGYAFYFIGYSIEYNTTLQASLSNIFIEKKHRGFGTRFIQWCDKQLQNLNCTVVYHHVKAHNNYGKILERLGYKIMNIEYTKRLDKEI